MVVERNVSAKTLPQSSTAVEAVALRGCAHGDNSGVSERTCMKPIADLRPTSQVAFERGPYAQGPTLPTHSADNDFQNHASSEELDHCRMRGKITISKGNDVSEVRYWI